MRVFQGIAALAVVAFAAPTWAKDDPAETTVICKDGSTSKGGKGACSGHGGVDKKATKGGAKAAAGAAAATAPAAPPAAPPPLAAPARHAPVAPAPSAAAAQAASEARTNAKNTDPTGAVAKCKDGTYSHAKSHTGACSRHGGVAEWLDAEKK